MEAAAYDEIVKYVAGTKEQSGRQFVDVNEGVRQCLKDEHASDARIEVRSLEYLCAIWLFQERGPREER